MTPAERSAMSPWFRTAGADEVPHLSMVLGNPGAPKAYKSETLNPKRIMRF